jgi:hypothetical protein
MELSAAKDEDQRDARKASQADAEDDDQSQHPGRRLRCAAA